MSDGPMIGRFKVSTFVLTEQRTTVYDGVQRGDNPLAERTAITVPVVMLDYRVAPRFGFHAATAIPLIARTGVVQRAAGPLSFRDEVRGLGDTVVGAWYRGGSPTRWIWTANGALSVPTGQTRAPRFRAELSEGSLVPLSRLQRGSGTLDPVFGASVEHGVAGGRWFASLAARTPVSESADGLRVGASAEIGSGWAHYLGSHRIMGFGRLDWLHREQDVFNGTPVLVGGGNWLYATPGIAVMVGKGINVQAEVKLPIYRNLANRQLDSHRIFKFGLSRSF